MKTATKLLLAAGFVVTAASVLALLLMIRSTSSSAVAKDHRQRVEQDPSAEAEVRRLQDTGGSAHSLVELYAKWSGHDDKRNARERILDALLANDDHHRALKLAMEALGLDPTEIGDDPMIDYAAKQMQRLWDDPSTYQYGRDFMLVQTTDKARVALAQSLTTHMRSLPVASDPDGQDRARLTQDLVDVYYQAGEAARRRLVIGVKQLGAADAAKVMTGAEVGELDVVRERSHQTQNTIIDLRARGNDPALGDVKDELHKVDGLDESQINDGLTRPQ